MAFIAGAFSANLNTADIGRTESGFDISQDFHHQVINADSFGDMQVDGVQQGADTIVTFTMIEYDLLATALFAQTGGAGGGNAKVGILLSSMSKQLIISAIGTTTTAAASAGYKIWTFPLAIVVDNIGVLLSSKLRKGPVRFRCFPNLSTGVAYIVA